MQRNNPSTKAELDIYSDAPGLDPELGWDPGFELAADLWLKSARGTVSKSTYAIYSGYVKNYMLPYLGEKSLNEVTQELEDYIAKIEANERAELVKKFYPVLSMILDYSVKCGFIGFNYAKVLAPFSNDEGLTYRDIGIDELAAILAQGRFDNILADILLLLDGGLSRGEILGLKWGDIDLSEKKLTVSRLVVARSGATCITEAEEKRELYFGDITASALAERRGDSSLDAFVIPSPSGYAVPFNPSAYRKKIVGAVKRALGDGGVTIELLGFILPILCDRARGVDGGSADKEAILALAMEKSYEHSATEPKHRRSGTGHVGQIGPNCWQGRYTPTVSGKRVSKNVYAPTRDECEAKLAEIIAETNRALGRS